VRDVAWTLNNAAPCVTLRGHYGPDLREVGLAKGPRLRILDGLAGRGLGGGGGGGRSGKCKVCLDRPVQTVLKPCGHSLMCTVCAQSVQQCPVCRQKIEETIRWFPTW
jgi:hypothetical protein